MEMRIMWAGVMALVGWFWAYLFVRQLIFDIRIGYPVVKKMRKADENLISPNADRYTTVSVITCVLFIAIATFVVIHFFKAKLWLLIPFFAGGIICVFMIIGSVKPSNKSLFENFCGAYYRFVVDDELRTAMYNRKISRMKLRLHDMNVSTDFIPNFKEESDS